MSMSDVVTAIESGKFDLDDTASTDSTPFYRVCLNDNHKTFRCEQIKNIASFIQTGNRNFSCWRHRQNEENTEQPHQQQQYQQGRKRRSGWSKYDGNLSSNRNPTPATIANEKLKRGGTSYAGNSGSPPTNGTYKNSSYAARSVQPPSKRSESKK